MRLDGDSVCLQILDFWQDFLNLGAGMQVNDISRSCIQTSKSKPIFGKFYD